MLRPWNQCFKSIHSHRIMTNPQHHYSLIKTHKSLCPQWRPWISPRQGRTRACKQSVERHTRPYLIRKSQQHIYTESITDEPPRRVLFLPILMQCFFFFFYIFRWIAVICLCMMMQLSFSFSPGSLWIFSHRVSWRSRVPVVAVSFGEQRGIVPDGEPSGTITELQPDCSLLQSSSLSLLLFFDVSRFIHSVWQRYTGIQMLAQTFPYKPLLLFWPSPRIHSLSDQVMVYICETVFNTTTGLKPNHFPKVLA